MAAALALGLPPSAYRRLPADDRCEVETYLWLQELKANDRAKRAREAAERQRALAQAMPKTLPVRRSPKR